MQGSQNLFCFNVSLLWARDVGFEKSNMFTRLEPITHLLQHASQINLVYPLHLSSEKQFSTAFCANQLAVPWLSIFLLQKHVHWQVAVFIISYDLQCSSYLIFFFYLSYILCLPPQVTLDDPLLSIKKSFSWVFYIIVVFNHEIFVYKHWRNKYIIDFP